MSKQKDSRAALLILRVLAIGLGLFGLAVLIYAGYEFKTASQFATSANAHPNVAEDQPGGLDGLGFVLTGAYGFFLLIMSFLVLGVAAAMFTVAKIRLKKLANPTKQGAGTVAVRPDNKTLG